MDREQQSQYDQLRAEAKRRVVEGQWLLRLTTDVALGGIGAVGIMDAEGGNAVVIRFWDVGADAEKLRSPVERLRDPRKLAPTIHEQRYAANLEQSRTLIDQLARLNLPFLPEHRPVITLDGVQYEIFCQRGQHSTTMSWVSTASQGWEALAVWFQAAWTGLSNGFGDAEQTE